MLQEREPLPRPEVGSCLTLRNELSEETHVLTKQEIMGKGHPGREQQGRGTQENCSATWLTVSGFMVMGLVSGLSLASHLTWPIFGLTQGPCWWLVHLSAKMDFGVRVSGRLAISSLLFLAPPEFSQLLFGGNTMFSIGTSCCETTQASGYHRAWPRWVVSVNSSLTERYSKEKWLLSTVWSVGLGLN